MRGAGIPGVRIKLAPTSVPTWFTIDSLCVYVYAGAAGGEDSGRLYSVLTAGACVRMFVCHACLCGARVQYLDCSFEPRVADGGTKISILACNHYHYLWKGKCTPDCAGDDLTHYGVRKGYRSCETPFTCNAEKGLPMVHGKPCECEDDRVAECEWKAGNAIFLPGKDVDRRSTAVSQITKCKAGFKLTTSKEDTHWCSKV